MYLLYRNRRDGWQSGGLKKRANPLFKIGRIPSKNERQKNPGMDLTPWHAEFTTNEDGNVDTGWSQDAFNIYREKTQAFTKRLTDHGPAVMEWEKAALVHVKAAMDAESSGGGTRKRKRAKVNAKEKPVLQLEFSDDEDEAEFDTTVV
jgi:hypothetical protein